MTSIVMLVHDRYTLTKQALDSLREHTDCNDYTLCLVDDGSTDFRVQRLIDNEALNNSNTTLVRVPYSGHRLSTLKNLGVYWSEQYFGRGEWLYLSDNDVYFTEGWLSKLTGIASRLYDEVGLWGGQIHPYHQPTGGGLDWTLHESLDGPSMLMSWYRWDRSGPFNRETAPGVAQSEDHQFAQVVLSNGWDIAVIKPHVVVHTGITSTDGKPIVGAELFQRVPGVIYE